MTSTLTLLFINEEQFQQALSKCFGAILPFIVKPSKHVKLKSQKLWQENISII